MDARKHLHRIVEFERHCRERGIPFTLQRRITYEAILNRMDHPTADQVYIDVRSGYPDISRMTVYRVLDLLAELGFITKVCHPGSAVRFDSNPKRHHHLVCHTCNQIIDFEDEILDALDQPSFAERLGFEIQDYSVQYQGYCSRCGKPDSQNPADNSEINSCS